MTLSTARVMIITLTLLVLMSWLHFSRFNGVISGGDPLPGVPCGFTPIAGRAAATEYWTRHCDPLRNAVPGEEGFVR
jgi:hypothetical protein